MVIPVIHVALATLAALGNIHAAAVPASPKPTLYIFGDSMSDVGAFFNFTHGLGPKYPHWEHRFFSGPVWSEYLSLLLDYNQDNVAIGMAVANNSRVWYLPLGIALLIQSTMGQIRKSHKHHPDYVTSATLSNDVAVLSVGPNGFIHSISLLKRGETNPNKLAVDFTNDVVTQLDLLKSWGMRNLVIATMPSLEHTPYARCRHIRKCQLALQ